MGNCVLGLLEIDRTHNNGVMFKYSSETSGATLPYSSVKQGFTLYRPRTVVAYNEIGGVRDPYSYESFDLGRRVGP